MNDDFHEKQRVVEIPPSSSMSFCHREEEEVGKMSRASASVGNEIFGDLNAAAAAPAG